MQSLKRFDFSSTLRTSRNTHDLLCNCVSALVFMYDVDVQYNV